MSVLVYVWRVEIIINLILELLGVHLLIRLFVVLLIIFILFHCVFPVKAILDQSL
jgi:hypothetical protein